jgi:hypothetical protein
MVSPDELELCKMKMIVFACYEIDDVTALGDSPVNQTRKEHIIDVCLLCGRGKVVCISPKFRGLKITREK